MLYIFNDAEQYGRIICEWRLDGQDTINMFGNSQWSLALCLDDIIVIKQLDHEEIYVVEKRKPGSSTYRINMILLPLF